MTFKTMRPRIQKDLAEQAAHHLILHHSNEAAGNIWQQHLCGNSHFCRAVVANGFLTATQMNRAAYRYRLGMARDGGVIFWQIDSCGQVYDGKIMYYQDNCHRSHDHAPTWVSSELKRFYLGDDYPPTALPNTHHCLFGTHLISEELTVKGETLVPAVAVVEAEKTAIILSEHYPNYLWLAPGGLEALRPESLFPLRHHAITLFPDTDETGATYAKWCSIAQAASHLLGQPVHVSDFLETHAFAEQKRRKIDLVDYLFEDNAVKPIE